MHTLFIHGAADTSSLPEPLRLQSFRRLHGNGTSSTMIHMETTISIFTAVIYAAFACIAVSLAVYIAAIAVAEIRIVLSNR